MCERPAGKFLHGWLHGIAFSSLSLGLAENLKERNVIAVDGDSACLMRLGGLYTLTQKHPNNLFYLVLDNGEMNLPADREIV